MNLMEQNAKLSNASSNPIFRKKHHREIVLNYRKNIFTINNKSTRIENYGCQKRKVSYMNIRMYLGCSGDSFIYIILPIK